MSDSDAPVSLYIAAYSDAVAAGTDWNELEGLQDAGEVKLDGLALVARDADGRIDVKDTAHTVGKGAVGGAIVGLIFPPAFLASAAVGTESGAGIGGIVSHGEKQEIKEDVEGVLPNNSSGIVALMEDQWVERVEQILSREQGDQARRRRRKRRSGQADGGQQLAGALGGRENLPKQTG